jgi:radical SAM protein with 4Fe4S-binding SPASM domain
MKLYRRLKSPLCVQIELTSACNCKCSHCYNYWRPKNETTKSMTMEVADKILQVMSEQEIQKACLTGGEPFLNFRIFKHLTEKMQDINIKVSTNTNLSAATDIHVDFALEHNLKILTTVMGSNALMHDSMTNAKGSFNNTVKNIKRCVSAGNNIMVNIVVSKPILSKVYDIASFIADLGVKNIFVSVVICPEYAKGTEKEPLFTFNEDDVAKVLNPLLEVREKYGINVSTITTFPLCSLSKVKDVTPFMNRRCVAGRTELGINFEGKVARCPQSGDYVGDLMTEDFQTIWNRIDDCAASESLPDVCVNCQLFKMCSGGCRVSAKSDTGYWNGLDPKAKPQNVIIVLKNIKKHYENLLPKDAHGYCRKEEFGAVLIRTDGNYTLLDKYLTKDEFDNSFGNDINQSQLKKHTLPVILKDMNCIINKDCESCKLHNVCYSIHNCR